MRVSQQAFSIGLFLAASLWFANRPLLEKWHDELGLNKQWTPRGFMLVPSSDLHGRPVWSGNFRLLVLSPCDSCTFQKFDLAGVIESSAHVPTIVVTQGKYSELPIPLKRQHAGLYHFVADDVSLSGDWLVHAPFVAKVHAEEASHMKVKLRIMEAK